MKPCNEMKYHIGVTLKLRPDMRQQRIVAVNAVKASMYGKVYIRVPPHYTTQTCSGCGHVLTGDKHIPLGVGEWVCPECGVLHSRDVNAAKNVFAKAREV